LHLRPRQKQNHAFKRLLFMQLSNPDLLRFNAYINGQWVNTTDTFSVVNPFNQEEIGQVGNCGAEETAAAISAAETALVSWRNTTAGKRSRFLKKWYDLVMANVDDLAMILTTEQGKPLDEARGEVRYGASFIEWFAEEGKRAYGDVIPPQSSDKRITVIKQPVGVVAAITPWNFPNAMITRKVAPALAAGCTVVLKPAEDTPLSALALAVLAEEAGIPAGVFNVVPTANPKEVGQVLTESVVVRKLSFTGSTEVGKLLMKQCAGTLKKLSLELGGNAPFIVFEDADIEAAVAGAMRSKFRNAGQTCICTNRFIVHTTVHDAFVRAMKKEVESLSVGDGRKSGVVVGPLINQAGLDKVCDLVADAQVKGATLVTGGKAKPGSLLHEPTLLANVDSSMAVHYTEIFGPVAPIFRFETEAEAISLANDTPYGLAAYFYGRDYARCWRVAEALEYGMVGINTGMISSTVAPFGGIKASGFGREGSYYGLADYMEVKYMCWGL
jgi:succinate-semialdehyde dehydrogenase/glutarate-semialdehyde dehydrogenase